jgi:hypothetical protein
MKNKVINQSIQPAQNEQDVDSLILGVQGEPRAQRTKGNRPDNLRQNNQGLSLQLNGIQDIAAPMTTYSWTGDNAGSAINGTVSTAIEKPEILIGIRQFWTFFVKSTLLPSGLRHPDHSGTSARR